MNRKQIIRMAEKCGIPEFENNESQAENIMRFAALVASAEREKCAKVCEKLKKDMTPIAALSAWACAVMIRAREQA